MKMNDILGFGAIFGAGYFVGKDLSVHNFTTGDIIFIVALLAIGFYFAVVLS
jgi:hypothetical protein